MPESLNVKVYYKIKITLNLCDFRRVSVSIDISTALMKTRKTDRSKHGKKRDPAV